MSSVPLTNHSFGREHVSYVTYEGKTYFARYARKPCEPHSSLTQLIQGIWEREPKFARAILRERIVTTEEMAPMNWGMLKTAARRFERLPMGHEPAPIARAGSDAELVAFSNLYQEPIGPSTSLELPRKSQTNYEFSLRPMKLALELARFSHRRAEKYLSDRAVGCVLELDGEILAAAHNTNHSNRCLHAEVNLLQSWWRTHGHPPPRNARLHSTLEPCRMCYGMLEECAPGADIRYLIPDGPGRPLRHSAPAPAVAPYEGRE